MTVTPSRTGDPRPGPRPDLRPGLRPGVRPWPRSSRVGDPGDLASVGSDDVVSADAVALEVPPAGVGVRALSALLDVLTVLVVTLVLYMVLSIATLSTDPALLAAAGILATVLGLVAYPTAIETLTRGQSVGRLAMGLRVVRDDGGPVSFQHALTRALVGVVEIFTFFGGPAFLTALVNPRGKRLGDLAAGTYVVRDRARLALPLPPSMPPELAAWAATADLAPPPPHLTLSVRQFLARAHTFEPRARHLLALRLADRLTAYVAPLPPPGTPPERFCCAVLAARRERDLGRLHAEEQNRLRLLRRRVR
ncbi:RDD family protein [Nocardioides zeae]|uniref:RDD family protein n=1 Tax=Nocardioides imazamoxiresistens TaxID=3231893 RepID=A0ABU3PZT1_9ACTN|nr:RDD family protein [Nocardioides zeae]MDT9594297.1 RDD family protein [Nocardioides zeae]